jgi:hypothetical protein
MTLGKNANYTEDEVCEKLHRIFQFGKEFNFENSKDIPSESGILVMFEKGENVHNQPRIVHIGQTKNLNRRINRQHYRGVGKSVLRRHIHASLSASNNSKLTREIITNYLKTRCKFKVFLFDLSERERIIIKNKLI